MLQLSQLSPEVQTELAGIAGRNATNIQAAILEAYEAGLLKGALNVAQRFAQQMATTPPPNTSNNTGGDEDDDGPGTMTSADVAWMRARGVDPTKKFRVKNSTFTITGIKLTRPKYPISATNQNGRRFKFPADAVRLYQCR